MASEVHKLPYVEIIGGREDGDYLTRIHVTPFAWWPKGWRRIYIHIFARPDKDREFHDHPWAFDTLVLWGGYIEKSHVMRNGKPTGEIKTDKLGWLSFRRRPAEHAHRIIELRARRVVTLVMRDWGRKREWGFWTEVETSPRRKTWLWVQWQKYLGLPERTYEAY